MPAEENPGRAGSRTISGEGPSASASDLPSPSSIVTMRRTDLRSCPDMSDLRLTFKIGPHHDEAHQARLAQIGPAMPIAELDHHVARPHRDVAVIEDQSAFAFQQK